MAFENYIYKNSLPADKTLYVGNGYYGSGLSYQSSSNPMYDAYYRANPYVNQTYKKTIWDNLFDGIFRTGYDKWRDEMALNAAQYDAGVVDMQQQNSYNSDISKSMRMKAAGLNPDLLGTGDVSDAASMNPDVQDAQIPDAASIGDITNIVSSISGGILNLVPQIMSFATNLSQLRGIRAENDNKELAFNNNIIEYVNKFFTEGISENDYREAFEKNDWTNILDAAKKDSDYLAETLFSSKGARNRFKLNYGRHSQSMLAQLSKYKSYDEFEKYRKSLLTQRSSQFFSDDDDTMMSLIASVTGPLERWQKRVNEINEKRANLRNPVAEQTLENTQIANQQEYENVIDPTMQAQAENTANERQSQENEIINATNDLFYELQKALSGDEWYKVLGRAFVGIMRAQIMSGMHVQFGRNSQYKVNGDTGVLTEQGQSNFNLGF